MPHNSKKKKHKAGYFIAFPLLHSRKIKTGMPLEGWKVPQKYLKKGRYTTVYSAGFDKIVFNW